MGKWYEPDETWVAIGVENREDYAEKFVVEGRFHADVHEDVVGAYQVAEHLMALAWFHYPMYDEALKKLLGILEMAVKLRCQELNIPLEQVNAKGKIHTFRLEELINKVCEQEPEKELGQLLHNARKLRNTFAHPKRHGFIGAIMELPLIPLINVLNLLFLDAETVRKNREHLLELEQVYGGFQKGLFVLEWKERPCLISGVRVIHATSSRGKWHSYWNFVPVLTNVYKLLSNHRYPPPITLVLTGLRLDSASLIGEDVENGKAVKLSPTIKPAHLELLSQHEDDWNLLPEIERVSYTMQVDRLIARKLHEYKYTYCWI